MKGVVCPQCGAEQPLRSIYARESWSGIQTLALHCHDCGKRSSLLKTTGANLAYWVALSLTVVGAYIAAVRLFTANGAPTSLTGLLALIAGSIVLSVLLMPALWALVCLPSVAAPPREPHEEPSRRQQVTWLVAGLCTAVFIMPTGIVGYALATAFDRPPSTPEYAKVVTLDARALEWSCRTLDGETITLGDHKDEVVFLNVWATWCKPCVAEMPSIADLARELAGEGVRFLLVSTESPDDVRAFADRAALGLPFATGPALPEALRTRGIPATFVLYQGKIRYQHVGSADWNAPDFREWLRTLQ